MSERLRQSEGGKLARRALDVMQERGIPPLPNNYEVWLTYHLGENAALNADIDAILAEGAPFDDATCKRLHDTYFSHARLEDEVMRAGSSMNLELEDVQRRLADASKNAASYGAVLEGASGKIGGGNPAEMQSVIDALLDATHKMRRHTQTLEHKLTETSREVKNLRTNLQHVREQAMTDALTGVANRKRLEEALARAVLDCAQAGEPMSVAICDIDHFKRFNDTWGHQTGDQIIRFVAQSLVRTAKDEGEVGRYGGEEFMVVMPGVDLARAAHLCELARTAVEKKRLLRRSTNEELGSVTMSAGVATLHPGESVTDLIARADALLYRSKHEGRNRVSVEAPEDSGKVCAA